MPAAANAAETLFPQHLHEFHDQAARADRAEEVAQKIAGALHVFAFQQAHILGFEATGEGVEIGHLQGDVMQTARALVEPRQRSTVGDDEFDQRVETPIDLASWKKGPAPFDPNEWAGRCPIDPAYYPAVAGAPR